MLKVYKQDCGNCLFSKDRIVNKERAKEIIEGCKKRQTYFICHNATMNNENICCHSFYEKMGQSSQLIRIAKRLNSIEFVEQSNNIKIKS